jgi:hypothetical protein
MIFMGFRKQVTTMKVNFALPTDEWWSVLKGALIAGAGVALTYLVQHLSASDFGPYGPVVVGVLSVLVNILRKAIGNDPVVPPVNPPANG